MEILCKVNIEEDEECTKCCKVCKEKCNKCCIFDKRNMECDYQVTK